MPSTALHRSRLHSDEFSITYRVTSKSLVTLWIELWIGISCGIYERTKIESNCNGKSKTIVHSGCASWSVINCWSSDAVCLCDSTWWEWTRRRLMSQPVVQCSNSNNIHLTSPLSCCPPTQSPRRWWASNIFVSSRDYSLLLRACVRLCIYSPSSRTECGLPNACCWMKLVVPSTWHVTRQWPQYYDILKRSPFVRRTGKTTPFKSDTLLSSQFDVVPPPAAAAALDTGRCFKETQNKVITEACLNGYLPNTVRHLLPKPNKNISKGEERYVVCVKPINYGLISI